IRPNQVIAAALHHSPLPAEARKAVVDVAERYLLTPFGLRTLAPDDPAVAALVAQITAGGRASQRKRALMIGGAVLALVGGGATTAWQLGVFAPAPPLAIADAGLAADAAVALGDAPPVAGDAFVAVVDVVRDAAPGVDAPRRIVATPDARPMSVIPDAGVVAADAAITPASPPIDAAPLLPDAPEAMTAILVANDVWCEITIDRVGYGRLLNKPLRVAPGSHVVTCAQPTTRKSWTQNVDVVAGQILTVQGHMLEVVEVTIAIEDGAEALLGPMHYKRGAVARIKSGRYEVTVPGVAKAFLDISASCTLRVRPELSDTSPHRGDLVTLFAASVDPDADRVELSWHASLCSADGCDATAFVTGTQEKFDFTIPPVRLEIAPLRPVESIRILLEARDELGARARPSQELVIPVDNYGPDLALTSTSAYGFVDGGLPVHVYAKVGDQDDGRAFTTLAWTVFTPSQAASYQVTYSPVADDPDDPAHRTEQAEILATGLGEWEVEVVATDRLGATTTQRETFTIVDDRDPCITTYQPIAPLDGTTRLPMAQRTLFQLPVVADDLDGYPAHPSDPNLGATTFAWSILEPGDAVFRPLAITGNAAELDPLAYQPGDLLSLRVQVYDRKATPIPCPDSAVQCSTTSQPTCNQRLTWKVVVR
ncbi:MAG: hypothetical protein NT062_01775, partial [Proteobacteria bacterium]|nr:hypothetical protein [Pseudomonadota bacterium]